MKMGQGTVAHMCNLSYTGGIDRKDTVPGWLGGNKCNPIQKTTKAKWVEGVAQVVEHLSSKWEALSSSTTKIIIIIIMKRN
jgi:hypothetical protein